MINAVARDEWFGKAQPHPVAALPAQGGAVRRLMRKKNARDHVVAIREIDDALQLPTDLKALRMALVSSAAPSPFARKGALFMLMMFVVDSAMARRRSGNRRRNSGQNSRACPAQLDIPSIVGQA